MRPRYWRPTTGWRASPSIDINCAAAFVFSRAHWEMALPQGMHRAVRVLWLIAIANMPTGSLSDCQGMSLLIAMMDDRSQNGAPIVPHSIRKG
jgi:hypothetical protein